jgi:hypothetical protein
VDRDDGHDVPGLPIDVYFGSAETPLPNPSQRPPGDDPDSDPEDDDDPVHQRRVRAALGFDPTELFVADQPPTAGG